MRIKKVSKTTQTGAQIIDGYSNSQVSGYSCDYINKHREVYTDAEQRIGTYNGKPLYRKHIVDTLAHNSYSETGIYITKAYGYCKSVYNQWWPLPGLYSQSNYNIYFYLNTARNGFTIDSEPYFNTSSPYEIWIEYTKDSDVVET